VDPYRRANRDNWDDRVPVHAASDTYDTRRLVDDPTALSGVVGFERRYLGDVTGRTLLHLQCHIGTDTLSWARLGAEVTGYDFSAPALAQARALAERMGLDATFVEGELYDAPARLAGRTFDVVTTGTGALCWLPDIRAWAEVAASLLAPGGTLLLREAHPVLWACDHERDDDLLVLAVPYFETDDPMRWDEPDTYTDGGEAAIEHTVTYEWNHGIGEILTAVLDAGLEIRRFEEHRDLEWQAWPLFELDEPTGRWVLPAHLRDRLPCMYTLVATKPAAAGPTGRQ
jgi:SAM-dependent methyltransferase